MEPKSLVTDKVQKVIKKPTNMGKKPNKEATKHPATARRNKSPPVKRSKDNGTKANENTTKKAAKNVINKYKLHMRQKNGSQESAIDAKHMKAAKLQNKCVKQEPKSPAVSKKDFKGQICEKQLIK